MTSAKMMAQLAKNWQRMTTLGRTKHLAVAGKGHCVVYTADERRFEVPLAYLGNKVFQELLRMSQEEFGFASDGRITLPCDASSMEKSLCRGREGVPKHRGIAMHLCRLCGTTCKSWSTGCCLQLLK